MSTPPADAKEGDRTERSHDPTAGLPPAQVLLRRDRRLSIGLLGSASVTCSWNCSERPREADDLTAAVGAEWSIALEILGLSRLRFHAWPL